MVAGNQFYQKFEKYNDLTLLTTKEKLEEAKKELEPYLAPDKHKEVENCYSASGLYYFVDVDLGKDPNFLTEIGASHIQLAGVNKYVLDRDGWVKSLECFIKTLDVKLKKLGGGNDFQAKVKRIGLFSFWEGLKDWEVKAKKNLEEYVKNFQEGKDSISWNNKRTDKACKKCVPGSPPNDILTAPVEKYHIKSSNNYSDEIVYNHKCKGENKDKCDECQVNESKYEIIQDKGTSQEKVINLCEECKKEYEKNWKCNDCGKVGKDFIRLVDQGKEIKICDDCKQKRDDKSNDDPNKNQNAKIWGDDFGQLKPGQRQDRIKVNNSWKEKKAKVRSALMCSYCSKSFDYDKTIEDYLPARKEVEGRLNTHKSSCSVKNNKAEKKRLCQEDWDQARKSKENRFYRCKDGCWGKVRCDKSIKDAEKAWDQAWADLKYHKKHECGKKGKRKIAIYFSPNRGGDEHVDINTYGGDRETVDQLLEKDNEGEIYQEQGDNKPKETKIWPWVVGGIIILGIIGLIWLLKPKKEKK